MKIKDNDTETTSTTPRKRARPRVRAEVPMDAPTAQVFGVAADWAFDVACDLAGDFPEDVRTIERVRSFVRARLAAQPASVRNEDVLFAFGLVLGAVSRDLERDIARGAVPRDDAPYGGKRADHDPNPAPWKSVPAGLRVTVEARDLLAMCDRAAAYGSPYRWVTG